MVRSGVDVNGFVKITEPFSTTSRSPPLRMTRYSSGTPSPPPGPASMIVSSRTVTMKLLASSRAPSLTRIVNW